MTWLQNSLALYGVAVQVPSTHQPWLFATQSQSTVLLPSVGCSRSSYTSSSTPNCAWFQTACVLLRSHGYQYSPMLHLLLYIVMHGTHRHNYAVQRGLVIGFCGQSLYCNRPYYQTTRFWSPSLHMVSAQPFLTGAQMGSCSITFLRESTMDWWKSQETELPKLATVAQWVLSIPASSAASECAFSAARLTVSQCRTALDSETVNNILFIHFSKWAAEHELHLGLNSWFRPIN